MTLDPEMEGLPDGAARLNAACVVAAQQVASTRPTTVCLVTPHGLTLSNTAAVYLGSDARGSAEWNGTWAKHTAHVTLHPAARDLAAHLQSSRCQADSLYAFSRDGQLPLRWAEVVPIAFLLSLNPETAYTYLIVSFPRNQSDETNLAFGAALFSFLHNILPESDRVAVVISGDLSHAHSTNEKNPIYLPDPRASLPVNDFIAQLFDSKIAEWISSGDRNVLLKEASPIIDNALSCGFGAFVWLQGGFDALSSILSFSGTVLENRHPTYFGMIVAIYNVLPIET
ncbi:hypothetical protein HK100_012031 [Physocladia obscura]|uniref:Extradiol ring-cleavage dioxygenase class III enzyme subunit B domain-containing protein n=1 Tax=Physocladia obscura TaxID=109957 RepID=A0AAD5XDL9_9FUNG|nr:hypothetical protein HK100_012031 [Physocladia obscura]